MQNVKPCPYCGGEIEMVKLIRDPKKDKTDVYRIECRKCRRLVARGQWFPIETPGEGIQRIRDYKAYIERQMAPRGVLTQTILRADEKRRNIRRAKSVLLGPDDE